MSEIIYGEMSKLTLYFDQAYSEAEKQELLRHAARSVSVEDVKITGFNTANLNKGVVFYQKALVKQTENIT